MNNASRDRAAAQSFEAGPRRKRFLIVRNPHAGLKGARLVAQVVGALTAQGALAHVVETVDAGSVRSVLAAEGDIDAVVAAGGDGTVRALALTLSDLGLDLPVGIIPAGTGNVLANEIGLPRDAHRLADYLVGSPACTVRVMQANEEPFLLMASSGFDAEVLLRLSVRLKQRIARAAYALPTLSTLAHMRLTPFSVIVDGVAHEATWVIVANARTYGGSFHLVSGASIFDDRLQAVLFSARTRAGRIRELAWLAAGRAERCAGITVIGCRQVEIQAPRQMPSQIDGDALGFGPVTIAPSQRSIRLIVPPDAR
ncbi:MAG: diacylglycerol kinase [Hyphomicrobiaceae bacterium]|nr:diacylglycerol kinase [Hyphomicrobiaceae bacterium]